MTLQRRNFGIDCLRGLALLLDALPQAWACRRRAGRKIPL